MKPRYVEGLARCSAQDNILLKFLPKRRKHNMPMSFIGKVTMYLIRDNNNLVLKTDFTHFSKLRLSPYTPYRIVWAAQYKKLHFFVNYLPLKILKVNAVLPILIYKPVVHKLPPVEHNCLRKRIVHRLLDEHTITLFCECPHSY